MACPQDGVILQRQTKFKFVFANTGTISGVHWGQTLLLRQVPVCEAWTASDLIGEPEKLCQKLRRIEPIKWQLVGKKFPGQKWRQRSDQNGPPHPVIQRVVQDRSTKVPAEAEAVPIDLRGAQQALLPLLIHLQ